MALQQIVTPKAEVQEDIVKNLEDLLERARRGEFESVLWFAEDARSRRMTWGCTGTLDTVQTIGRLEVLRHSIAAEFVRGA
jgi:hypothetical protein